MIEFDPSLEQKAKMKVVGVGGSGGNAVNRMVDAKLAGVEFIAVNTDAQDLEVSLATKKIQLGQNLTNGLGAGANVEVGRRAAEETKDVLADTLTHTDMVFITAGMGGGTGTGAAPVIAEIARDMGALTVAIVTKPFAFEGKKRMERALTGLEELKGRVDTMIVIPNQRLLSIVSDNTTLKDAFRMADEILYQATKGISDLISIHGIINLDFADVRTVMSEMGDAIMGTGTAAGADRAVEAAQQAIASPLLEDASIAGAQGVLVNITGGTDMTLVEIEKATSLVSEAAGDGANIIFGAVEDETVGDELRVTVIATGLNNSSKRPVQQREQTRGFDVNRAGEERRMDMDRPAFQRKEQRLEMMPEREQAVQRQTVSARPQQQAVPQAAPTPAPGQAADDLEVPTFLRRQMNNQ